MRRLQFVIVVFVTAALLMPLMASAQAGNKDVVPTDMIAPEKKYALVGVSATFEYLLDFKIPPGLGDYASVQGNGPIPFLDDAAYMIHDILIDDYGWLPSHITMLINETDTAANIVQEIGALKQYDSPDSLFLIVLGGHGWVTKDVGSLLPGDEDNYPNIGGKRGGNDPWDEVLMTYDGNVLTDDAFKLLFDELDFQGKLVVQFFACCGSGLIEDMAGSNRLAVGVGNADRLEMHFYDIDSYIWYALSGCTGAEFDYIDLDMNPDANGDGGISVEEAYNWAVAANEATLPTWFGPGMGPTDIYMLDGIEGETFL